MRAPEAALRLLRSRFGSRLRAVVLHGSHAARAARADSDVNVLAVVQGLPAFGPERRALVREVARSFLWEGHGRLSLDLLAPGEVGRLEPGVYRVLAGEAAILAQLLPETGFARQAGRGGRTWTSRGPS